MTWSAANGLRSAARLDWIRPAIDGSMVDLRKLWESNQCNTSTLPRSSCRGQWTADLFITVPLLLQST
jgi:hypothetical protein